MDEIIRKCCPNCNQLYYLKHSSPTKGNLPLFLACGHSICEKCVRNILCFPGPIECKICHRDMTVEASQLTQLNKDKGKLYQLFPVNIHMVGELTMHCSENAENKQLEHTEFFVDLYSMLKEGVSSKAACMQCRNQTTKMCQQCATILCDKCFIKSHKTFVFLQSHVLKEIADVGSPSICKIHNGKSLDYHCNDCKKSICMDCFMVGGDESCKNHNVVSLQEVNADFLDELRVITPKADETFRRLTKTAYDVGHLLLNMENGTGTASEITQITANIEQHFSVLCSFLQKHKHDLIDRVTKNMNLEKTSLRSVKDDLTVSIKKAVKVMGSIRMTSDPKNIKAMNLAVLLEDAKQLAESPWYLKQDAGETGPVKVTVNDDLCALISDYIHLTGNSSSAYKLCSTADLGEDVEIPPPPPAPVYAPVLPKDMRQNKQVTLAFLEKPPRFCHKRGSVTSLNSCSSGSSQKSYLQSNVYNRPDVQPVQPSPESQHPIQFQEGSRDLIYISHIVNPHDFYVQRASHQELVKEILRQFRTAVSLPKPSVNHVTEGNKYLAFNNADNTWQRCRVVGIDRKDPTQPLFHVFCFDFGCTETVNIEKLRILPPASELSPIPLAIHCSLANCEPKTGAWNSEDSFLISKIMDNKQAVIYVRRLRSAADGGVTVECDVTTFEDGVSLAHALVFHERANMPNPKLKYPHYPMDGCIRQKDKIYIDNANYKPKTIEEVYISHIVSPDKFYVRRKYMQADYEQLSQELEQQYSLAVKAGTIYLPEIGMPCCVHVSSESAGRGAWARAQVLGMPGQARVQLLLLDTGAPLLAHWSSLRYLSRNFTNTDALATQCHLAGVTPPNRQWSPVSVAFLQQFRDQVLELHVERDHQRDQRDSVGVTLFHRAPDSEEVVCVNREMITHKFAIGFGIYSFNKCDDAADQVITNKSSLDEPVRYPQNKNRRRPAEVQILKRNPPEEPQKIEAESLKARDKGLLMLEANVLEYRSPSHIYISLVHQQKTYQKVFENLQEHYSKNGPAKKTNWQVGDKCCTKCIKSRTWRRAVISEIEGDNAKLFYYDFALVETRPLKNLAELTSDFASIGNAAIKCHLCGVIPAGGEEWPSLTKEYLKELLDIYRRVFIKKLGNFKNNSMPIEIWVHHTFHGGALDPDTYEWRCLNKKIIEQGLGIPDKSVEAYTETKPEAGDEVLSFLNVTGSIHDWLQLEPMPTKTLPELFSKSPTSTTPIENEDGTEGLELESSNVMFISDWLPPEPFPSNEFIGIPTYIGEDGVIYIHAESQKATLDLIRKALHVRFQDPDPKAKYQKWVVGEPCVALFYLDNLYYRGKVLDVNNETSTCLIHYIDFGNEEQCSFENLRKSIALHQIPTQAHRCVLNRIRPNGDHWEGETLDYIHKSIIEKKCSIKVAGDSVDGITPVELIYDKLWINDHLVEFELATYTDGSKAVVRRFAPTHREEKVTLPAPAMDDMPDYIVESDSQGSHEASSVVMAGDWNEILDVEERHSVEQVYVSYSIKLDDEFQCDINVIEDAKILELELIHDADTALMHEEMFKDLQVDGANQPPINGIFENKACIALSGKDQQWYRASILQYSEAKQKIKVKYVDHGDIEVVDLINVREIHPNWVTLMPYTVSVKLHGVKLNPEVEINEVARAYSDTLLGKGPFNAKVIKRFDSYSEVELRNEAGELVYQNLIEKEVFLKCES